MKRFICYICTLLIIISLAGCAGTNTLKETNANSTVSAEPTIVSNIKPTPIPSYFEVDTEPTTTLPNITSTPTPSIFDIDDVKMQDTPQSSCLSEIGYDPDWEVLVVRFRDSDSIYTYSNFPKDEWSKFISADSLGRWYNIYIKSKYECERTF